VGVDDAEQWRSVQRSGKRFKFTYKDAIILLSDGLNTQDRYSSSAAQIDARQKLLCDHAKRAGIAIYTIQVNTSSPPDPTSAVATLRERFEQLLPRDICRPDGIGLQVDRKLALQAARREMIAGHRRRKKSPAFSAGLSLRTLLPGRTFQKDLDFRGPR
jgi:hypothetical protein